MDTLELRPHHLLDIVCDYEPGREVEPAESGNAVHVVTRMVDTGLDTTVTFVMEADDICRPCRHLLPDGRCERILERYTPPKPMQEYNDRLDRELFRYLGIEPGATMSMRELLVLAASKMPGIESAGTPPEDTRPRFEGLGEGLRRLGIPRVEG